MPDIVTYLPEQPDPELRALMPGMVVLQHDYCTNRREVLPAGTEAVREAGCAWWCFRPGPVSAGPIRLAIDVVYVEAQVEVEVRSRHELRGREGAVIAALDPALLAPGRLLAHARRCMESALSAELYASGELAALRRRVDEAAALPGHAIFHQGPQRGAESLARILAGGDVLGNDVAGLAARLGGRGAGVTIELGGGLFVVRAINVRAAPSPELERRCEKTRERVLELGRQASAADLALRNAASNEVRAVATHLHRWHDPQQLALIAQVLGGSGLLSPEAVQALSAGAAAGPGDERPHRLGRVAPRALPSSLRSTDEDDAPMYDAFGYRRR